MYDSMSQCIFVHQVHKPIYFSFSCSLKKNFLDILVEYTVKFSKIHSNKYESDTYLKSCLNKVSCLHIFFSYCLIIN